MSERMPLKDDPLDALRRELASVSRSPEFAVRVRQRIEQGARPGFWTRFNWRWTVPVSGMAAAAMLAFVVLYRPAVGEQPIVTGVTRVEPSDVARPPLASTQPSERQSPVPSKEIARQVTSVAPRNPMLEVVTNQSEILQEIWARAGEPSSLLNSSASGKPVEIAEIVIAPVEIEPVVVKWLVEPRPSVGPLPIILRMVAEAAERSPK